MLTLVSCTQKESEPFPAPFSQNALYFDGEKSIEGLFTFDGDSLVFESEGTKITITEGTEKIEYGGITFESPPSTRLYPLFEALKKGEKTNLKMKD